MFSRLYKRNFDSEQGSKKANRVRITLQDRAGSKEAAVSHPLKETLLLAHNGEEPLLKRNNTIGRVIHNGSQQVYYPVNPSNSFIVQPIRGRYNSNIVQSNHSSLKLWDFSDMERTRQGSSSSNLSSLMRRSFECSSQELTSYSDPKELGVSDFRIKPAVPSDGCGSFRSKIHEIEDSENERLNSNRENPSLSVETYVIPQALTEISGSYAKSLKKIPPVHNILLSKERLPALEIFSTNEKADVLSLDKSISLDPLCSKQSGCHSALGFSFAEELISKLKSKSAFSFIKFNLLFHFAAIVIQCYFRRYLCRKYLRFAKLGPAKLLNSSAAQIQACWRSFLVRFGTAALEENRQLNKNKDRLEIGRNWSFLHEKCTLEICTRRNFQAIVIQRSWKNMYINRITLERNILADSIFSARAIARETIEKYLRGFIVRRRNDLKYKLIPIKWTWSLQCITSIYILLKSSNTWSEPKKMWLSEKEKVFRYNLFLQAGTHQIVFKAYFDRKGSGEGNAYTKGEKDFKILCDSSLETIPNEDYQFANCIKVSAKGNHASAFKHSRETITATSAFRSGGNSIEELLNSDEVQTIREDLINFIELSPSYRHSLKKDSSDLESQSSPSRLPNEAVNTPSTNADLSPPPQALFQIH